MSAASGMRVGWLHDVPAEAWKNGGGTTRTLAQGGVDAAGVPGWRVSLADIARDGAYSSFVGQTRHSLIVNGKGVDLVDGDTALSLREHGPVTYAGEPAWQATLVDGPVRALNVMVDSTRFAASIDAVSADMQAAPAAARLVVAFNREGQFAGGAGVRPTRLHAGEYVVDTCADDILSLSHAGSSSDTGTLALIRIWSLADTARDPATPRKTEP